MTNPYYNPTGAPTTRSSGLSATIRAEFAAIAAGLDKMPSLSGAGRVVAISSGNTALEASSTITISGTAATVSGNLSAAALLPTGATVPANGLYLPAANTVAIASNTTLRWSVNATGNHTITAPSSGAALSLTALAAGQALLASDGTVSYRQQFSASAAELGTFSAHRLDLVSNSIVRAVIDSAGSVGIGTNAPASLLHLSTSADEVLRITNTSGGNPFLSFYSSATRRSYIQHHQASGLLVVSEQVGVPIRMYTDGVMRVIIDPTTGDIRPNGDGASDVGTAGNRFAEVRAINFYGGGANLTALDAGNISSGNLAVARLNSGTGASATTFWRGDGTWGTPVGSGGTVTSVNLTAPAAGITVSGGPITSSGSITLALADDLAAVEALSGTGPVKRTGASTWTTAAIDLSGAEVTGTLATARVSGAYTGITQVGTLTATTVVSTGATDEVLRLDGTGTPYLSFYRSGVRRAYIQQSSAGNGFLIVSEEAGAPLRFYTAGSERWLTEAGGTVRPVADNTYAFGTAGNRWSEGRFVTLYGAGSNITALNATELTSGTVPVARISGANAYDISGALVNGKAVGYRGMPAASVTTGAFAAADAGKCVYATGGVTIPNSTMAAEDTVVVQNTTGSSITITKTVTTAYNTATGSALGATFTLAARGRMSVVFTTATECYVSGNIS